MHALRELRLSGEGADLHREHLVVVAFRSGELLNAAVESHALAGRDDDRRSVRSAFVGPHVVHVVRRRDRGFEYDPVDVAVERLDGTFPCDALRRCREGGQHGCERQQTDANQFVHGRKTLV